MRFLDYYIDNIVFFPDSYTTTYKKKKKKLCYLRVVWVDFIIPIHFGVHGYHEQTSKQALCTFYLSVVLNNMTYFLSYSCLVLLFAAPALVACFLSRL